MEEMDYQVMSAYIYSLMIKFNLDFFIFNNFTMFKTRVENSYYG